MKSEKKVAIVLAGCGVFDGSEIHEATMTMYAVKTLGGVYDIFAPDITQHHVINHRTGEEMPEIRNVLTESARIARGKIRPLSELNMTNYDALMLPGGFGVAKNLSDLAFKGANCSVNKELENSILQAYHLGKPIGALCISPAVIARVLQGVSVTIGQDSETAQTIEQMGGTHITTGHGQVITDHKHKLATTPCYMLDAQITDIAEGALNVTKAVFEMIS